MDDGRAADPGPDVETDDGRLLGDDEWVTAPPRRRRARSCLPVLLVLAVLGSVLWFGGRWAFDELSTRLAGPEDFEGPGSGEVLVQVPEGATSVDIGRDLKDQGVVASVEAFTAAAREDAASVNIQVGFYELQREMRAEDALAVLVDPDNLVQATVTVPEGLQVRQVLGVLAEETDFSRRQFARALRNPELGLPDYADGNAEGYLFPATYTVGPRDTPLSILQQMVGRWRQAADDAGLEERAEELGKTPAELMIIASLVEAEGRGDDLPKVARVIYNRLDGPGDKGGTNGLLQVDAANAYGIGESGNVALSAEQLAEDTPYNTRLYPGLPPTPIENPGEAAIAAAVQPADGPWYYYVTVDLRTGETRFSETYEEFLENRRVYQEYCETSDAC